MHIIYVMGKGNCLNLRHQSIRKVGRAAIAAILFMKSIPAASSVRIVSPNIVSAITNAISLKKTSPSQAKLTRVEAVDRAETSIAMLTTLTQDEMAYERLPDRGQIIDPGTKELNFSVLVQVQKAVEANRFNPADYVPYKSLSSTDGGSQVTSKILSKTVQTIVTKELADDSLVNLPVIKTASYTKAVQNKNYKLTYGIHNTLAETDLQLHKAISATLSYNVASPELKFGFHWSF